jgi:hypothetical protein
MSPDRLLKLSKICIIFPSYPELCPYIELTLLSVSLTRERPRRLSASLTTNYTNLDKDKTLNPNKKKSKRTGDIL